LIGIDGSAFLANWAAPKEPIWKWHHMATDNILQSVLIEGFLCIEGVHMVQTVDAKPTNTWPMVTQESNLRDIRIDTVGGNCFITWAFIAGHGNL
jgi:hypothetical protein